jgi:p-methyltransferase
MPASDLDCLIIGYNDVVFAQQEARVISRGPRDPERGMFMRDHLLFDGDRLPYMDVMNRVLRRRTGRDVYLNGGEVPNLAVYYLASYLIKRGLSAECVSLFSCEKDRIRDILENRRPRTVAITTTYYIMPDPVVEIARFIRDCYPGAKIVVGGPLVSNLLKDMDHGELAEVMAWMDADVYVNESQGEWTLGQVAEAVRDGGDLSAVPNLLLPTGSGDFTRTKPRPEANVLDECVIDWDLFADSGLGRTVHTRTARSCAFKCAFCDYPIRAGDLTLTSVEVVEQELRQLDRLGVEHMVFIDDTFNVPGPRFKELCRMMARNKFNFQWYSFFRAATARDEETFDLMAESKCAAVFLGIEAGDDNILKNMSKVATVERYGKGIERLETRGIATFASFISGFPGETEQTVRSTVDFINSARPTFFRTEPWWYNHRAPISQQAEKFGLSGREYRWRHNTMDIDGAVDACDELFADVDGSLWMPGYNFDFWALPYLIGKGITMPEIIEFHRLARQIMEFNDRPGEQPAPEVLDQMYHVFDGVPEITGKYRTPAPRNAAPVLTAGA